MRYAFFYLSFTLLTPTSAANLVSTRVRAALQTIAPVLKQESGVNVHVIVPQIVSLYLLRNFLIEVL